MATGQKTPLLKLTDFLPTKFSGDRLDRDECTAHLLTFDDYLDAHDIDPTVQTNMTTIVKMFKRTLNGQARLWIDGQTFSTYDEIKTAFTRRFSPAKSSYARVTDFTTLSMTDGENVETFLQKRVVTDFRFLNSRIRRINHPFPLLTETLKRIGHANTRVMSVIDLKSAFHCIPLSETAQKYTGLASYHGGKHYYYKRLAQGLNVSPGLFQAKIDDILGAIPESRNFCIAHHDDIILFSPDKISHRQHLAHVFKALSENGLKISPKKCKLFRDDVEYMGHRITVNKDGEACFQPLNKRCTSIRNMTRPKTPRQVRRLIGAVNYVAGFFPNIQSILRPLHQLTKKTKKFKWTSEHDKTFEQIKQLMTNPPVLHMPHSTGRIRLYSDTSRTGTGSYLTQIINGKERVLGYYSKVLPDACKRYSVTELELFGLLINVSAFVDHSAIVQILKSKEEPCTTRLQKLILKLSEYAFKIGYKKGSELVLADFLSRIPTETHAEIDKVIPISLCLFNEEDFDTLNPIQPAERRVTRAFAKKMGISVPSLYPEKAPTPSPKPTDPPDPPPPVSVPCSERQENTQSEQSNQSREPPDTPLTQPPRTANNSPNTRAGAQQYLNKQKPVPTQVEPRIVDRSCESASDQFRDVPTELYTPPKPLTTNVNNIVAGHIPRQQDIDKILQLIKRKIIRDYNLPIDINRIRIEQESSPHFKSVYDFLAHNILPSDKKAAKLVQTKAEEYVLCDGVLFRLFFNKNDDLRLQLAVPESLTDTVISQYHDNLLSNHQVGAHHPPGY